MNTKNISIDFQFVKIYFKLNLMVMSKMNRFGTDASQRSLTQNAYDQIQNMIVRGDFKENQLISERDLAATLGCGRTPVREALQKLGFEGFVEFLPRRGILITSVDISSQLELLETRRPLEVQMVKLASKRADTKERAQMIELAERMESAVANDDRESYLEINKAIHQVEAAATGNRFLRRQMKTIHNLSRRFWYSLVTDDKSFIEAARFHVNTLRAISAGDSDLAVENCNALLDLLETVTRYAIEKHSI